MERRTYKMERDFIKNNSKRIVRGEAKEIFIISEKWKMETCTNNWKKCLNPGRPLQLSSEHCILLWSHWRTTGENTKQRLYWERNKSNEIRKNARKWSNYYKRTTGEAGEAMVDMIHKIATQVWREEKLSMGGSWMIVNPIYKKGDKLNSNQL